MTQKYHALYLKFGEADKVISKEMDEDVIMDLDSEGKMVGIEILSASEHIYFMKEIKTIR